MAIRATSLKFVGQRDHDGRPLEYFAFVPARDLDGGDIASLTDEQYEAITGGETPLYVAERPVASRGPVLAPDAVDDADDD